MNTHGTGSTTDGDEAPPGSVASSPDLLDWLHSGRLRLLDADRRPISPETWALLPPHVQERAQTQFRSIVRGGVKAAVLYLRPGP